MADRGGEELHATSTRSTKLTIVNALPAGAARSTLRLRDPIGTVVPAASSSTVQNRLILMIGVLLSRSDVSRGAIAGCAPMAEPHPSWIGLDADSLAGEPE